MGTDVDTSQQSHAIIEHDLLTTGLKLRLSSIECASCSSEPEICETISTPTDAMFSSNERSQSCTTRSCSRSEQHAIESAFHSTARAVQVDTSASLMVSSSANRGQEPCIQFQPASMQHLSDDAGSAAPAEIPSAARRRLFGLQHGYLDAQGYEFLSCSAQSIYGTK